MNFFRRHKRETFCQIIAQLRTENAARSGAGSVTFIVTVI